jgi:predicted alpha/beta hydrolase family esterase
MPRIEKKLQAKGIDVFRPLMPTPRKRVYANFKAAFDEYDTLIDEHSVIIGYSCGSAFLVHWLGENKRKVAKLILVAPRKKFLTSKSRKEEKNPDEDLYDFTINPDLAQRVGKIVMFTSNDEAPAGKESLKIYYEALGGKIIELPHH